MKNKEQRTNLELRAQNSELKTRNSKLKTQNSEPVNFPNFL